jgi:hypothetical protein
MRQRSAAVIGCVAGLLGGVGLALLCAAGERSTSDPRYQLQVWTTPPFAGPSWNYEPRHGAYRIDTQTGDVWRIEADGGATKLNFQ